MSMSNKNSFQMGKGNLRDQFKEDCYNHEILPSEGLKNLVRYFYTLPKMDKTKIIKGTNGTIFKKIRKVCTRSACTNFINPTSKVFVCQECLKRG